MGSYSGSPYTSQVEAYTTRLPWATAALAMLVVPTTFTAAASSGFSAARYTSPMAAT